MEMAQVVNEDSVNSQNQPNTAEAVAAVVEKSRESELVSHPAKKSKEERGRKKDERSVEQVLKALSSLGTSEEKLAAMCKKYSDIVDENRKLQLSVKQCDKRTVALQREKEQLQAEQSKAVLTRSRLESLCRELQRQNKVIKEESLLKIREEEEKRKVVSAKFQATLSEITALMQQNNENNSKLRDENLEMQNKFKSVCEQFELREQQVEKISKQMQLESQLHDAKLAKVKIEMVAEKEILANEKKQLMIELAAYQGKCQELQKTEAALRSQISMYTEKYDEFQNALARSNQIYGGFKGEMEKMSKKITKLEKETSTWKMKWESSHKALLQMAAEKQQRDADLALATKQLAQLQKLCRTLQSERSSLLGQLKNEGLTPKVPGDAISSDIKENQECEFKAVKSAGDGGDSLGDNSSKIPNDDQNNLVEMGNKEQPTAVTIQDTKPEETKLVNETSSKPINVESQNDEIKADQVAVSDKTFSKITTEGPATEVSSPGRENNSLHSGEPRTEAVISDGKSNAAVENKPESHEASSDVTTPNRESNEPKSPSKSLGLAEKIADSKESPKKEATQVISSLAAKAKAPTEEIKKQTTVLPLNGSNPADENLSATKNAVTPESREPRKSKEGSKRRKK